MTAQAIYLVPQRLFRNLVICRFPVLPMLPEITAAPSREHENSAFVGQIEKFLVLELSFQTDRVQPHVLHVSEFFVKALLVFPEHHVRPPAAAANQNIFSVNGEDALAIFVQLGRDLADTEFCFGRV